MANERKVRLEAPLSDAIPTIDALRQQVPRFRFRCEVVPPKNGYKAKVIHCNVFAPADISEMEVRREFKNFIEKIKYRHALKEEAKRNQAESKEIIAKIRLGLKRNGKK